MMISDKKKSDGSFAIGLNGLIKNSLKVVRLSVSLIASFT